MASIGDTPFDPSDYSFTVAEAAQVSGVTEMQIRNWIRRDVTTVGKKNRLGRIMFNALDIVGLRVVGDLGHLLNVDPSASIPIAAQVSEHCGQWLQKDNHHLHATEDGFKRETRLVVHLSEDHKSASLTPFAWGDSVFGFKVSERGEGSDWTRHPFLILPVEQIFCDVLDALFAILESEES